jgi:hypothetical protein
MINGHTLITGLSRSGKTTLTEKIASNILSKRPVFFLDSFGANFPCTWQTQNQSEFIEIARTNKSALLVVDDAADNLNKFDNALSWIGTQSRHWGHCFLINSQRYINVHPNIRNNAIVCFAFKQSKKDARDLCEDFVDENLLDVPSLNQFEFYGGGKYVPFKKYRLNLV